MNDYEAQQSQKGTAFGKLAIGKAINLKTLPVEVLPLFSHKGRSYGVMEKRRTDCEQRYGNCMVLSTSIHNFSMQDRLLHQNSYFFPRTHTSSPCSTWLIRDTDYCILRRTLLVHYRNEQEIQPTLHERTYFVSETPLLRHRLCFNPQHTSANRQLDNIPRPHPLFNNHHRTSSPPNPHIDPPSRKSIHPIQGAIETPPSFCNAPTKPSHPLRTNLTITSTP